MFISNSNQKIKSSTIIQPSLVSYSHSIQSPRKLIPFGLKQQTSRQETTEQLLATSKVFAKRKTQNQDHHGISSLKVKEKGINSQNKIPEEQLSQLRSFILQEKTRSFGNEQAGWNENSL